MPLLETPLPDTLPRCLSLLLVVLLSLSLTGCATPSTVPLPVLPKVLPEQACLTLAEPLPQLTDPSMEGLIRLLVDVADSYHILAARHRCLADFLR